VLDVHGEALRIYFAFMEQMTWLMIGLAIISAANVWANLQGGFYNGSNKTEKSDPQRAS